MVYLTSFNRFGCTGRDLEVYVMRPSSAGNPHKQFWRCLGASLLHFSKWIRDLIYSVLELKNNSWTPRTRWRLWSRILFLISHNLVTNPKTPFRFAPLSLSRKTRVVFFSLFTKTQNRFLLLWIWVRRSWNSKRHEALCKSTLALYIYRVWGFDNYN